MGERQTKYLLKYRWMERGLDTDSLRTVTYRTDENFIGVTWRISLLIGLPSMYSRSAGVQFQPGVDYIGRRPMRANYTFRVYQFNNSGRGAAEDGGEQV